jgi:hypothetical protein
MQNNESRINRTFQVYFWSLFLEKRRAWAEPRSPQNRVNNSECNNSECGKVGPFWEKPAGNHRKNDEKKHRTTNVQYA